MHFDLSHIDWTAIAALATALLAFLTWRLAKSTSELARETDQDVQSTWRPVLILAPNSPIQLTAQKVGEQWELRLDIFLLNAGKGPALNCCIESSFGRSETEPKFKRVPFNPVPADGGTGNLKVTGSCPTVRDWSAYQHRVFVIYQDIADRPHRTILVLGPADGGYARRDDEHAELLMEITSTTIEQLTR